MGPLFERDGPLHLLAERLQSTAASGAGHVALVAGEAGVGKTSLLRRLAKDHPRGTLWWGGCDALETPNPLAPLHDVARDAGLVFRGLAEPAAGRAALFSEVFEALRAAPAPTLFVVEDVHWADAATLDLLKFLGRRIDRLPAVLVLSFRDDELPAAHPLRRVIGDFAPGLVTRIDLPRLSEAAVAQLARSALRSPEGLYASTRGNPFFVTEMLIHGTGSVPRTVQDLVLARYARLPAGAREVVQLAAIVPARIERRLVEALAKPAVADLEACLNSGLLQADGAHFSFRHELARVAVEASLPQAVAQALHSRALEVLLSQLAGTVHAARLAHHAVRAGDAAAVLRFAPAAGEEARARGAHREAAAHLEAALRVAGGEPDDRRAAWLDAFAVECLATGRLADAISALGELQRLHSRAGNVLGEGACLSQLALARVVALRNAEADEASLRAIALLETQPAGVELARAWQVQAQLRMLNRDCREAVAWGRKALALAGRMQERRVLAAAHGSLGAALVFIDYEAGCGHMRQAVDLALAEGLDYVAANNLSNLGSASGEVYRWAEADRYLGEAIAFSSAREIDYYRDYATAWLGLSDLYQGRWEEAAEHARQGAKRSDPASTARIMALVALGRLRTRRGEAGAAEALDQALALAAATGTLQRVAPVRCARAEAAFLAGDLSRAASEAREALPLAVRQEHPWFAGELAYWLWRCGEAPHAGPMAEPYALGIAGRWQEAAAAWERIGCPFEQARALEAGDVPAQRDALDRYEALGAAPAAHALRKRLRAAGVPGVARGVRPTTRGNPYGLTAREAEVLQLLCLGLRNAQIAARLVRSVRTVDHHIAAILGKLGVASRLEAIRAAREAGIGARDGQGSAPI